MGPQPSWLRAPLLLLACGRQPTDCMPVAERPTGWCVGLPGLPSGLVIRYLSDASPTAPASVGGEPHPSPMVTRSRPFAPNEGSGARGAIPYVQTTTSLCRLAPTSEALPPDYGPDAPEQVGSLPRIWGPTFLVSPERANQRVSTPQETLHYDVTVAAIGAAEGAHESRPSQPPRP